MKKFICTVCGYVHEGETAPEVCPVCGVGAFGIFGSFTVFSFLAFTIFFPPSSILNNIFDFVRR